jgi:hypothetical protein
MQAQKVRLLIIWTIARQPLDNSLQLLYYVNVFNYIFRRELTYEVLVQLYPGDPSVGFEYPTYRNVKNYPIWVYRP